MNDTLKDLKASMLGKVLTPEELEYIAKRCTRRILKAGEVLCEQQDVLQELFVVTKGCLKGIFGSGTLQRTGGYVNSGELVGTYSLLHNEPSLAMVTAEFESSLLVISKEDFAYLHEQNPGFQRMLWKTFHTRIDSVLTGKKLRRFARNVVFVQATTVDCRLAFDVAEKLADRGERVAMVSNRKIESSKLTTFPVEERDEFIKKWQDTKQYEFDRIIFWFDPEFARELIDVMDRANEILWCFEAAKAGEMRETIGRITEKARPNVNKIKRVCLLSKSELVAPTGIADERLHRRDFIMPGQDPGSRMYQQGVDRVTRHLCDIKIGLSLAGGGARGLVHFGILRALDRAGLSFDFISGTSAGAMFGLSYACAEEIEFLIESYRTNLTPKFPFTIFKNSDRWFLVWKFRTRGWDAMLRPYFDYQFDQLQVPFYSATVDLIKGELVVRESGDIIHAMLESLNLPGIARPILRDGKALVDGGVLNNLPADVLVEKGADFVLGVNVSEGLKEGLGDNHSGMKTEEMSRVGNMESLFRTLEVMGSGTSKMQRSAVDILLNPDTSSFSFTDFTQGHALAEVGEAAVEEALPQIKDCISELMKF